MSNVPRLITAKREWGKEEEEKGKRREIRGEKGKVHNDGKLSLPG